jgi:hypothetical protein
LIAFGAARAARCGPAIEYFNPGSVVRDLLYPHDRV